eukprot:184586-Prymnesium_polylepis.1
MSGSWPQRHQSSAVRMDSKTLTTGELGAMCTPRLAAKKISRRETPATLLTRPPRRRPRPGC